jgi:short-subunit dehydrogenase
MASKGTALITGASSGLGEQFAGLFAKDGYDVVLVARNAAKLEEIKKRLEAEHSIRALALPGDLGDRATAARIHRELASKGIAIDFLVNNAGFGSNGAFLDLDLATEIGMVELNVVALVELTHLFVRGMRERKSGRVLNIGSTAGFQPGPYMATYYATKAFVMSFSEALAHELRDSGVTVTCYCPGATATEFSNRAGNNKSRLFQRAVAKADQVAIDAYRSMMRGEKLAVHGVMNGIVATSIRFLPRPLVRAAAARLNQQNGA